MKIVKIRFCNNMGNDYLADSFVIYIERQKAKTYSVNKIVDDFKALKERCVLL